MVVNAMITTIVAHANQPYQTIYHVGSSVSNPLKYQSIQEYGYNYFSKHPWINKDGKPVIVGKVKVLKSMDSFQRYFGLRYLLPLQVNLDLYYFRVFRIEFENNEENMGMEKYIN